MTIRDLIEPYLADILNILVFQHLFKCLFPDTEKFLKTVFHSKRCTVNLKQFADIIILNLMFALNRKRSMNWEVEKISSLSVQLNQNH